eukprot:m.353540 g.353540  ORF g.353540 m.353540 type:complete len:425 (-) comp55923_c0_seq11:1297-2571(-)
MVGSCQNSFNDAKLYLKDALAQVPKFDRSILINSALMTLFGVINAVTSSMVSFVMPGYPSFANYFPSILCAILLVPIALIKKEQVFSGKSLTRTAQWQYCVLTIVTCACWLTWTYSGAWVDGNLQQVLVNLGFVFVYIFSVPILKFKISRREIFAAIIITCGVIIGSYPALEKLSNGEADYEEEHPDWYNSWYFILAYIVAIAFQSLQFVYQDRALRQPYNLDEASCLFWTSMYSVVPYVLFVPMESVPQVNALPEAQSFSWAWENQAGAFRCLIGQPTEEEALEQCLQTNAWMWLLLYGISFVGFSYFANVLYKKTSAFWTTLLQTLMTPIAAVVFNFPVLVGDYNYAPFTGFAGGSFGVIILGVIVLGTPDENAYGVKAADSADDEKSDEQTALLGEDTKLNLEEQLPLLPERAHVQDESEV